MAREELVKVPAVILGGRLRGKRKGLRMSQHQLGGEDFSPSYVSAVERGKIRPSLKALYILADRLGEPVTYFLQDEGIPHTGDALEAIVTTASIEIFQGKPADAIVRLRAAKLDGHTAEMQARLYLCLGQAYLANREPGEAVVALQEALHQAEIAGSATLAAFARLYQGTAYLRQQKAGLALDFHRRCLQSVQDGLVKDIGFALQVYGNLGEDFLALGQEKDAMVYFDEAIRLAQSASDLRALASAIWQVSVSCQGSDPTNARIYAEQSLAVFETLRMLSSAASMRNTYATILSNSGDQLAAKGIFLDAQALGERIGDAGVTATATIRLGELASEQKDYASAEQLIAKGVDQATAQGDELVAGARLLSLAQVYAAENKRADAERQFEAAIAILQGSNAHETLSKAYFRYGQALVAWGESSKGSEYLEKAYLQSRKA